ncbi:MAG: hydroxysqualene dehydroxylase HpnE [Burkholderiaceae bacterium]
MGAGWAGLAAAIGATQAGHATSVFETGHMAGGRARALPCRLPDGSSTTLDNGQHILIGACTQVLGLLQLVGVDAQSSLLRLPLQLVYPDGNGLRLPRWPHGLDVLGGVLVARGWSVADKASLLLQGLRWRRAGFGCASGTTVEAVVSTCSPRVLREFIAPLCISSLNVPPAAADGQIFLRVMHDALFAGAGGSDLLLPRVDLSSLFPHAAARWLAGKGAQVRLGTRAQQLSWRAGQWQLDGEVFDQVVLATSAPEAARIATRALAGAPPTTAADIERWTAVAAALQHTAITTVYAWREGAKLARPVLALRSSESPGPVYPAQFVFDRGQLGGPRGLLAFVVSASRDDGELVQTGVLAQARVQLGLDLVPVQTVVEKRAAFDCAPGVRRPGKAIASGLWAAGDYVEGPYPSTLEGAVRAGLGVFRTLD